MQNTYHAMFERAGTENQSVVLLADFMIEELETRLEMGQCCNDCICREFTPGYPNAECTGGYYCTGCHEC